VTRPSASLGEADRGERVTELGVGARADLDERDRAGAPRDSQGPARQLRATTCQPAADRRSAASASARRPTR
jgi:hypothetical protein